MATTSSIPFSKTSLPGGHASTPSGFSGSMGPAASVAAVLEVGQTTLTAYEIMSTTGLAVIDGTTLTWRGGGITLGNGDVVSLGENGLEDSTTTAFYEAVTVGGSSTMSTTPTAAVTITKSSTTLTSTKGNTQTGGVTSTKGDTQTAGGTPTSRSSTGTASAASTSSSGTAPSMSAGKALALLGAVGGMVVLGL